MDFTRWLRHQWDRAAAVLFAAGGLAALVLGLVGVNHARLATQQIPYLASGGLVGLFLLGIGATLWLSADLRDEWRKLDDISRQLRSPGQEGLDDQPDLHPPPSYPPPPAGRRRDTGPR